jgi:hypothetical protein
MKFPLFLRPQLVACAFAFFVAVAVVCRSAETAATPNGKAVLTLNASEYLEMPGLNVMLAHDFYPEGHQGGVGIIQNGLRVATNGDVRLEPTPGQWQPVPKVGSRQIDRAKQEISVRMEYPDPAKDRKGFNPVIYPDLNLAYTVRVRPEGAAFRIVVDLESPLPEAWVGKVGFNLELFPGVLFGRSYYLDDHAGVFPRQPNGPGAEHKELATPGDELATGYQLEPFATGQRLVIAPESERQRLVIERVRGGALELRDGRDQHTNGWFVVRATIPAGATQGAIEWLVSPHAIPNWKHEPVVQVSQVGYHPKQAKTAVIELDGAETALLTVKLLRFSETGAPEIVVEKAAHDWGRFLRYRYVQFDFSTVQKPGLYAIEYGAVRSAVFQISETVYRRGVWQPTLEYFLPIQMCHMRVNDRYRVWHGGCHLDDARMAPINHIHFDGYAQGSSTLTRFQPGDHVPGLDLGGWHDAGDDDLRVESQAETIHGLALAYETFKIDYDNTTIDQATRVVEIHRPDGKPDLLQQIEHGALTIIGGYKSLGRLYRGIIVPTKRQYVYLGDFSSVTDNQPFDAKKSAASPPPVPLPGSADDRWVFTENNPQRELLVAGCLAAASRPLKALNPSLAGDCLRAAEELWTVTKEANALNRVGAAAELLIATGETKYADFLTTHTALIAEHFDKVGWLVGRTLPLIMDDAYRTALTQAARKLRTKIDEQGRKTPYGVPYEPAIWGAGWGIQKFGAEQVYLHQAFPEIFPTTYLLDALNFILGCHPGSNTASFVSGVGAKSMIPGYGFNRADWSSIPGGVGSGTALIRPDFPELLEWPFLWQQTEYVLGYGTTDYLTLVLAADKFLNP